MLKKIAYYYETSNQKDKRIFYEDYLHLLNEWCKHYGIEITNESIRLECLIEEEIACLKYHIT